MSHEPCLKYFTYPLGQHYQGTCKALSSALLNNSLDPRSRDFKGDTDTDYNPCVSVTWQVCTLRGVFEITGPWFDAFMEHFACNNFLTIFGNARHEIVKFSLFLRYMNFSTCYLLSLKISCDIFK